MAAMGVGTPGKGPQKAGRPGSYAAQARADVDHPVATTS